jgi:hypothetical protein
VSPDCSKDGKVILTRSNDAFPGEAKTKTEALKKTLGIAKQFNPDVFISLHMDVEGNYKTFQTKLSGFEAYISDERPGDHNIALAKTILTELQSVYTTDFGVRQREGKGIYVLDKNIVPAVLLECGYINNPKDLEFISNDKNQDAVAKAILIGLVSFVNNKPIGKTDFKNLNNKGIVRDTIPKVDTIYWIRDLAAPAKKSPTREQLTKWTDGKMYGVWLDGKRINNSELARYKPSDFSLYYVSKLTKTALNYGKHYYQVNLYTNSEYERTYLSSKRSPVLIREITLSDTLKPTRPLIVINGSPMPALTPKELNALIPADSIISMTTLSKEYAIKKYGVKAENGAIEIKTGGWGPVLSPLMKINKDQQRNTIDGKAIQDHDNKVFVKVEIEPSFPGGQVGWSEFLRANIRATVPVDSGAPAGTYTVFLQFIVDRSGNISNMKPITDHGFGMEQECIRVMKLSPDWEPARQNGHIVTAYKKQPFTFVIA